MHFSFTFSYKLFLQPSPFSSSSYVDVINVGVHKIKICLNYNSLLLQIFYCPLHLAIGNGKEILLTLTHIFLFLFFFYYLWSRLIFIYIFFFFFVLCNFMYVNMWMHKYIDWKTKENKIYYLYARPFATLSPPFSISYSLT